MCQSGRWQKSSSVNFLKAKYILPCCPSIPPIMTQFLSVSPTPPSQLAPELHCFNQLLHNAVPRAILLRTIKHSPPLVRAHFYPLSGCRALRKPPKPSSRSQLIVNSPGLGAFDCSVAWQQLPWKPFLREGWVKKRNLERDVEGGKEDKMRCATKLTTVAWSPQQN